MTKTLKQKIFHSGSWAVFGHLLSSGLRLGGNLILTRLLVPEMFGVMAIVSVVIAGISMFSDLGILQNIIQSKRSNENVFIETAWTIQVLRGVFIFLVLVALSVLLHYLNMDSVFTEGSVYATPQLPWILSAMSITALFSGFNSVNLAILNRELRLKEITLIEVISQVLGLVTMIVLAFLYSNIWGLVVGSITTSFVKMILSHLPAFGNKSRFRWEQNSVKEIIKFGKWIFGSSIFTFLVGQGDRLLLGNLISPEELGVYNIAFFLAMSFKDVIRKVMASVFYPVLSEVVRDRPNDLKKIYYQIRTKVDVLVMIVVGLLASSGHLIINLLYDERYYNAGWMLEVLALSTIFLGTTMAGVCLLALGDARAIMKLTSTSAIFLFISVPISFNYFGMQGAVVAIAVNSIVEIPLIFYMMSRYKLLNLIKEFRFFPLFFLIYFSSKCSLLYFGV